MIIHLKKKHIKEGVCGYPFGCAVTLAIAEAVGHRYKQISVTDERVRLILPTGGQRIRLLPERVSRFIRRFDSLYMNRAKRHALRSFKFNLDV